MYNQGIQHVSFFGVSNMNDFLSQIQSDELVDYRPTAEDWADYAEYLDSIGYDEGDDDWDEDPDSDRGFQNLDTNTPW
tara:strand:- start:312 stop:545 length:234 start_codon:yes stop_codon:yes gene_type:complete